MRFRTEIELAPAGWKIDHSTPVLMLGSCFTDEVGARLAADGFRVMHNPLGPLFNPLSICRCIDRALAATPYTDADLTPGLRGCHCLDYATRFSGADAGAVLADVNEGIDAIHTFGAKVAILTLGTAYVFERVDTGAVVGNCHKFPADFFRRRLAPADEIATALGAACRRLAGTGVEHIILTISPIRHLADGLHGNNISKATLMLAADAVVASASGQADIEYFPAYEMLIDDLRDYRFYADDLRHPSPVAVDYIYERFGDTYFTSDTRRHALEARKAYKASLHRTIL